MLGIHLISLFICGLMQSWNAYLGRLSSMKLCISEKYETSEMASWNSSTSASAFLDFYVDKKLKDSHAIAAQNFKGTELRTKIKSIAVGGAGCGWG